MVPSVKVLALKVCFGVAEEVNKLLSFLRCFPHVETLHVNGPEEEDVVRRGRRHSCDLGSMFWKEVGPIECVESHVSKVLLDQFSWGVNELRFLELVLGKAEMLESAVLVLYSGMSSMEVTQSTRNLARMQAIAKFASDKCELTMFGPPGDSWSYGRASDLSLSDPFP